MEKRGADSFNRRLPDDTVVARVNGGDVSMSHSPRLRFSSIRRTLSPTRNGRKDFSHFFRSINLEGNDELRLLPPSLGNSVECLLVIWRLETSQRTAVKKGNNFGKDIAQHFVSGQSGLPCVGAVALRVASKI